ncbi:spermatogenesis-associated protein 6 isoform X2 [Cryptotermes secundus]|uniref:spermatogenesis-associated protein 6 isoform X2 n=1 Tax=Cryptotermes secundus TaxID=105785 RepID=UPI000CD7D16D|nr:spermatogenesis-associated protein 6 isoform X2 [Cryptotermes secundus]
MLVKVFNVSVELDVHAVTCPGVWLCPNGKIILKLFMFGSSARAPHLPPIFPLLYHQKFVFQKTFTNVRYLTDLQHLLGKEFVHAELIQSSGGSGAVLASFETTVLELLYPSPCVKGLIAGVDIDLLMEPRKCFPGILGPKIKVSTKTTIEEVLDTSPSNKRNPGLINHKLLSSKNSSTTKGCYQNKTYHDKHQPHRSPELRKKPESPCCKQNPSLSAVMPNTDGSSRCTCGHCQMDTTGNRSLYSQSAETFQDSSAQLPTSTSPSGRVYSPHTHHNIVKASAQEKEEHHTKWRKTRKDFHHETCHGCKCHDSLSHRACNCPVCSKYRTYFDKHTGVDRSAADSRESHSLLEEI